MWPVVTIEFTRISAINFQVQKDADEIVARHIYYYGNVYQAAQDLRTQLLKGESEDAIKIDTINPLAVPNELNDLNLKQNTQGEDHASDFEIYKVSLQKENDKIIYEEYDDDTYLTPSDRENTHVCFVVVTHKLVDVWVSAEMDDRQFNLATQISNGEFYPRIRFEVFI